MSTKSATQKYAASVMTVGTRLAQMAPVENQQWHVIANWEDVKERSDDSGKLPKRSFWSSERLNTLNRRVLHTNKVCDITEEPYGEKYQRDSFGLASFIVHDKLRYLKCRQFDPSFYT